MTTTVVHGDGGETRGRADHRPFPIRVTTIVAASVVVGVALGRFATTPDVPAAPVSAAPASDSAAERLARFEQRALEDPDNARTWQNVAIAAVQAVAEGEPLVLYNTAAGALERAERLAPGDRMNDVAGGLLALARHDFALARTLGTRAHEADPFDSEALAIVVDANVEMGAYEEAKRLVEKLLGLRPSLAAYSRLSYIRELHGDVDGALEALILAGNAGTGTRSDLAQVTLLRASLMATHGDLDDAERLFHEAHRHSSTAANDAGLARVLIARDNLGEAQALLEKAMRTSPRPDVALLLDEIYVATGNREGRAEVGRFLDANLADERAVGADVDMEASLIAADHGKWGMALHLARAAYERRPENIFTAAALAWALHGNGSPGEAIPLIEKALRLGTRDPVLHYRASEIFAANGMTDRADKELSTALEINRRFSLRYQSPASGPSNSPARSELTSRF